MYMCLPLSCRYLLQLVAGQDWPLLGTHAPPLAAAGRLDLLKVLLEAAGSPPPPPPGQQVQQPQQADAAMATATAHGDAAAMGAAVAAATAMPPGGGNGTVAREARWPSVSLGTVRALLLAAAPGGHLEVIRWLLALGQSFFPKDAQPEGLEAGSGASRGAQSGSGGCGAAAAAGSRSGSSSSDGYSPSKLALYGVLNSDLFCAAVRSGSVQLLELLRGAGCTWDPLAVWEAAAETGCCDVLHWLFMQGWPLPVRVLATHYAPVSCSRAVSGDLQCVVLKGALSPFPRPWRRFIWDWSQATLLPFRTGQ